MPLHAIADTTDESQWQANLNEQGVTDSDFLARAAVDLGMGMEVVDPVSGYAYADLISFLASELLSIYRGVFQFSTASGDLRATALRNGLARLINISGQTYTYKRSAATCSPSPTARIQVLTSATKYEYFTAAQVATWAGIPAQVVTIAGDFQTSFSPTEPAVNDLITIYGADHTVRHIVKPQVGSIIVKTILFVSL